VTNSLYVMLTEHGENSQIVSMESSSEVCPHG
jgi:hypothetical protein